MTYKIKAAIRILLWAGLYLLVLVVILEPISDCVLTFPYVILA